MATTDNGPDFTGPSPMTVSSATRTVQFDAVLSRRHGRSASATSAPVEDGSAISDHVILDPETLSFDGVVSDHPLDDIARVEAAAAAVTRSEEFASILSDWWRAKETLRVVTRLYVYTDMVIERLDWSESEETAEALAFSMSLRKIRKARLELVQIERLSDASKDLAAGPVHRGRQHLRRPTPAEIEYMKSLNSKIVSTVDKIPLGKEGVDFFGKTLPGIFGGVL